MDDFYYFEEFRDSIYEYYYEEFKDSYDNEDELNKIINQYIIELYRMDNEINSEMIHLYE
jgi:hypothetical protein